MPTFTHFYVVTEAGTCIYSKSTDNREDQHLLSGFMTAMDQFTKKMLSGDLESVSVGQSKYFVTSAHGLLFITRTNLNTRDNEVNKDLAELRRIFFENFPPEHFSANWDNMSNIGPMLDPTYDRYFKESDQKMREAIW